MGFLTLTPKGSRPVATGNADSINTHHALGFEDAGVIHCFRSFIDG